MVRFSKFTHKKETYEKFQFVEKLYSKQNCYTRRSAISEKHPCNKSSTSNVWCTRVGVNVWYACFLLNWQSSEWLNIKPLFLSNACKHLMTRLPTSSDQLWHFRLSCASCGRARKFFLGPNYNPNKIFFFFERESVSTYGICSWW